jgi:glycosyltransferase involved in cell wall biosynthesis
MVLHEKNNVFMVADADLSRMGGDVVRIVALASELEKNGLHVTLITPRPGEGKPWIESSGINLVHIPAKQKRGSITNILFRTYLLIKKIKELRNNNSIFIIETSMLGGYFAIAGFHSYILDVHGICFDEIDYSRMPSYFPKLVSQNCIKFIEKISMKRASSVIAVSDSMARFIADEFGISRNKIVVIPNGFFESKVNAVNKREIKEDGGLVTFLGILSKWANVDKIIKIASILKSENAKFCIIGGGQCLPELKNQAHELGLSNVVFTGFQPIEVAYETIARSQVMLLPFPEEICTKIACPIKVLEYMAFGKAMVIDDVSDICRYLKEKNAAIVCDPKENAQFSNAICQLLNDNVLRRQLGANAKDLSTNFSWACQGKKLADLIKH